MSARQFANQMVMKASGSMLAPREIMDRIGAIAPEALETLEHLMRHAKSETVRYRSALEILALAGVTKETRLTLTTETSELDEKEINTRLTDLLNKAGSTVIEHEISEITEISEIH